MIQKVNGNHSLINKLEESGMALFKKELGPEKIKFEINISARPSSKIQKFTILQDGSLKMNIREKPVDGEANLAIIKLLAKGLGISGSSVSIISGAKSKLKKIELNFYLSKNKNENYYLKKWISFLKIPD